MLREKIAEVIRQMRPSEERAATILALFQDELDKVVDVEELNDLQKRIAGELGERIDG